MKQIFPLLITITLGATSLQAATSYGSVAHKNKTLENLTHYGSAKLEDVTLNNVAIYGSAQLKNCQMETFDIKGNGNIEESLISGNAQCDGSLKTKKANIKGNLITYGSAYLKESSFSQKVDIHGSLKAEKSTFKGDITLYSSSADLENVSSKNITVNVNGSNDQLPRINMKKTTVDGDVTFQGKAGTVYINSNSTITGKVINGRIEHR